jgi:hypothetical protein
MRRSRSRPAPGALLPQHASGVRTGSSAARWYDLGGRPSLHRAGRPQSAGPVRQGYLTHERQRVDGGPSTVPSAVGFNWEDVSTIRTQRTSGINRDESASCDVQAADRQVDIAGFLATAIDSDYDYYYPSTGRSTHLVADRPRRPALSPSQARPARVSENRVYRIESNRCRTSTLRSASIARSARCATAHRHTSVFMKCGLPVGLTRRRPRCSVSGYESVEEQLLRRRGRQHQVTRMDGRDDHARRT